MRRAALRLAGFGAGYLVVVLLERLLDHIELQEAVRRQAAILVPHAQAEAMAETLISAMVADANARNEAEGSPERFRVWHP